MSQDLKQAINVRIGDSKGITQIQLLKMASDYKKAGLKDNAALLWKISSPGVFRAVDTNGDRFISKNELNKIAGFDGDENNLTYKDLWLAGCPTPVISMENEIPASFVSEIRDAVQAVPNGVRDFIFSPQNGARGYEIFVWNKLLTELYPDLEKEMYYASGCTSSEEKRIDMSTKVRRRNNNDAVENYSFPKNNTYHELGHAFDNMLFEFYFSDVIQETKEKYYSFHSGKFQDAYSADLKELKEKIEAGKIPKDEADRILRSRYVDETDSTSGKEETFAEIFCMIMIQFEDKEEAMKDFKRIPQFLSYFPHAKEVVLNQIEFVSAGFKIQYNSAVKNN